MNTTTNIEELKKKLANLNVDTSHNTVNFQDCVNHCRDKIKNPRGMPDEELVEYYTILINLLTHVKGKDFDRCSELQKYACELSAAYKALESVESDEVLEVINTNADNLSYLSYLKEKLFKPESYKSWTEIDDPTNN